MVIYIGRQVFDWWVAYNRSIQMREVKETREARGGREGSVIRMYHVGEHFKILQKVGRGTYGTVYKVRGLKDGRCYAIKKLQNNDVKLQQEGFPITALREITLLKQIDHPNIISLKEIILSRPSRRNLFRGSTFLVFQYMDHDFAGLFRMGRKFALPEIKCIFRQLLEGVAYLHSHKILHRDIKSANILLNDDGEVKLADFGLGRKIRLENVFTYKVVTLWYRAPELLWGFKHYTDKIDVWSIGCVAVEFFTGEVLFKKESQHAQIERIYEICGDFEANDLRISEEAAKAYQYLADMRPKKPYKKEIGNYLRKKCPGITEITVEFIQSLLHLDPNKRLTCEEALRHPFFNEKPLACNPRDIQKQEYQCHEMFKDRSIKIQRAKKEPAEVSKPKPPVKEERPYRDYHKRGRQNSVTSQSRQFSSSSSSSNSNEYSGSYSDKSKRSNRSKSRSARKRSKSRDDRDRRHGYHDRKHHQRDNEPRKDKNYHRDTREDRKDRREDPKQYKFDKERRIEDKDDKYYREKHDKRFKEPRRKDQRYNRFDERIDERRDPKDDRKEMKDDRRVPKDDRRDIKYERRKDEKRDLKDERRQIKDDRREKDERRDKDQRRDIKDDRRDKDQRRGKDDQRRGKDDERLRKDQRREKDNRRQRDDRRGQRHHDYKRQSKQKKYDKYQKGKYDSRGYDSKPPKGRPYQDQKDYKRRVQRENGHQNGKHQSKQKYSSDYRLGKKPQKFAFVREKGQRRKQAGSSSSSGSSYSSHHFKKQKQRNKYSYDRKAYYKKQHSSSGSRAGYN